VVGPNGAGKTTLLRSISGLEKLAAGEITFGEKNLKGVEAWDIVRLGIAHVPQNRRCFGPLSVEENLLMGGYSKDKTKLPDLLEAVYDLFPVLKEKRRQHTDQLSGGQQQMVAVGRAMMLEARLIMLDEPSLGLAPMLVDNLTASLQQIRDNFGTAILIVEQNVKMALSVGNRGYILQSGRVIGQGSPDELRPRLREAYLGKE
jgi:branched-chain amino acid transport system ATP-binding protein